MDTFLRKYVSKSRLQNVVNIDEPSKYLWNFKDEASRITPELLYAILKVLFVFFFNLIINHLKK